MRKSTLYLGDAANRFLFVKFHLGGRPTVINQERSETETETRVQTVAAVVHECNYLNTPSRLPNAIDALCVVFHLSSSTHCLVTGFEYIVVLLCLKLSPVFRYVYDTNHRLHSEFFSDD